MIHPQSSRPNTIPTQSKRPHGMMCYLASVLAFSLLISCVPTKDAKEMTLQEAKQVTISMSGKTFTPPPRTIKDILAILEGTSKKERAQLKEAEKIAVSSPPTDVGIKKLVDFYMARANALARLGRFDEAFQDGKELAKLAQKVNVGVPELTFGLGISAQFSGDFRKAIEYYEQACSMVDWITNAHKGLVELYLAIGNHERAKKWFNIGLMSCYRYSRPGMPAISLVLGNEESMRAAMLESEGKFAQAEPHRRKAVKWYKDFYSGTINVKTLRYELPLERQLLIDNLIQQGRILEGELEARILIKESVEDYGKTSTSTSLAVSTLGGILVRQGRTRDAEELSRIGILSMTEIGIPSDSPLLSLARVNLGRILASKKEFKEALHEFDQAGKGIPQSSFFYEKLIKRNTSQMLSLIDAGRYPEADDQISKSYEMYSKYYGEAHYLTAEVKALRGILNYRLKKYDDALADFSIALPVLTSSASQAEADYLKKQRLISIQEAYLSLLREISDGQIRIHTRLDPVKESFRMADSLMGRSISSAMSESSARVAVTDKDLADLIRREQDASQEIKAMEGMLANLAGMPEDEQTKELVRNLRNRLETFTEARRLILDEVRTRFPRYTDFTNPQPATLEKAQGSLRPNEALLVMYPAEKETYIWCVPQKGTIRFAASKLGRKDLTQIVGHLRKALAPEPAVFGDIPEFDVQKAHELYQQILKPVEAGWKEAKDLLVVAPGALGQIPFSVLPTSAVALKEEKGVLFSKYKEVPWLVRKVSVTNYPAVSSFLTLRTLPEGDPNRKAFVGFGDPVFTKEQLTVAQAPNDTVASRGGNRLRVRGARVSGEDKLDNKQIASMSLEKLNRLPDTAEEVRDIASALGASPEKDTFTGERATEMQVKNMDLSDRRVIAFASHALLPWDLDGLDQPAIALSSPAVVGGDEDGVLTMSEIMKLRLNADWAVLSACNTGASEGEGAEAVSGLGRAFFYAGTRAVLVTMWPVETTSAKSLMTGLFTHYTKEKGLSRAQAQRKAINEMIDSQTFKDPVTGKTVASYAHPFFWAPYIIMGDGG